MEQKKFEYSLDAGVVNYLLAMLDKVQVAGVQSAKDLISVTELLQKPTNAEDLEKEQLQKLQEKYAKKEK